MANSRTEELGALRLSLPWLLRMAASPLWRPEVRAMSRIDEEALTALGGELVHLAEGIRLTWQPAAERLGCDRLLLELQAATASHNPGTLRSLARRWASV